MTIGEAVDPPAGKVRPHSVLVIGGCGFVGKQVVRCLLDDGVRTSILCRSGEKGRAIDGRVAEVRTTAEMFAEPVDRLRDLIDGFDTLVHCAWCTDLADYLTASINTQCLEGTIRLAHAFSANGGTRFVGLGTCAEYDNSAGLLFPTTPLRPANLYAACKAAAFLVLDNYLRAQGVSFTWCRLFYLYGEGEREDRLIPTVRRHLEKGVPVALTAGTQIRDFLDVRDAGRLIADAVLSGNEGVVNICSERGVSVRSLVETVADEYNRRDLLRFGERSMNPFDPPCIVGRRQPSGSPS
jgi:dTDP-6-deoxy-L-talose 4-dehydrogenase (NAD+)